MLDLKEFTKFNTNTYTQIFIKERKSADIGIVRIVRIVTVATVKVVVVLG